MIITFILLFGNIVLYFFMMYFIIQPINSCFFNYCLIKLFTPKLLHFTEKMYNSSNSYQQNSYIFLTNSYLIAKGTISIPN